MEFRIDRNDLSDHVTWAARVLPARPAGPVLAGILLDAGERLTLSGFDFEASACAVVDADITATGRAVVSGRLFAEIVRGLPGGVVQVAIAGSRLRMTCGEYVYMLPTMPAEEYPSLPGMPAAVGAFAAGTFAAAATQVAMATSRDETVPMLTGVWLEFEAGKVTLAGTDRYRMALRELAWTAKEPSTAAALVPARPLTEAVKALPEDAELTVGLTPDTMIGLVAGGRQATIRLLDERFVNFRSHFPREFAATAEVHPAELAEAVKRVALVAERNAPVWLSFSEDRVVIETGSDDDAGAVATLAASLDGDQIRVAFNPRFLLDGLTAMDSVVAVFGFTSASKPVVIMGGDLRYLVQPIRRAG